jgi:hypothetical protein
MIQRAEKVKMAYHPLLDGTVSIPASSWLCVFGLGNWPVNYVP